MPVILGIDPGLATTGYGIITHNERKKSTVSRTYHHCGHGVIATSVKDTHSIRLHHLYEKVKNIVKEYQPALVGIEALYFSKNVSSAVPVAQAMGVILLLCAEKHISVYEFSPKQIKQSVTGNGNATKQEVTAMTRLLLRLTDPPSPNHAADALAIAITCEQHMSWERYRTKKIQAGAAADV